jgi:hypothetical protein
MKVEHITALSHDSQVRDTADILPDTANYFRPLIKPGMGKVFIPKTSLYVSVTVDGAAALFDLSKGDDILFFNVCCFGSEGREQSLNVAREMTARLPGIMPSLKSPTLDHFLISIPINPMAGSPDDLMTCGEISLYIYQAIKHHEVWQNL